MFASGFVSGDCNVIEIQNMTASSAKTLDQREVEITRDQLPLCCPPLDVDVYGLHPRVWLAFGRDGKATCPYCGTDYLLKD